MGAKRANDFTCAICQREVDMRWTFGCRRGTTLAPFCASCEHTYTQGVGKPAHGSFRDRREVMRGFAIAEALHTAARHRQWKDAHVNAA